MPLQATSGAASYDAFGGGVPVVPNYIEEVFSTYLYTGNGTSQTITNNIDISTKGGLVWIKQRSAANSHQWQDTARGAGLAIFSDLDNGNYSTATGITSFGTSGFSVGINGAYNANAGTYASWTFRKQPKFFDIVTYTGNGVAGRTVAHNLGSVPGCIIIKRTDAAADWIVYHRSLGATKYLILSFANAQGTSTAIFNDTEPTSTVFSVGTVGAVNASGGTYVAYIYAHDAGGFGLTGTDNVISCGSFTADGSGNATINLGYEPQWLLLKRTDSTSQWYIVDNMRGFTVNTGGALPLYPNLSNATGTATTINPTSTGFYQNAVAGSSWIYIAIRRGPMKVPTVGTNVFGVTLTENGSAPYASSSFPVDFGLVGYTSSGGYYIADRLRGAQELVPNTTAAESAAASYKFDYQNGWLSGAFGANLFYSFRRAPSFFDEVCYTGTGVNRTVTHNLGVMPEIMIFKKRSAAIGWGVVHSIGATSNGFSTLNTLDASTTNNYVSEDYLTAQPTSTTLYLSAASGLINANTATYVVYLFATCAGVSKVGSYTGTGALQTVNCGFTSGARFVLIKRTDSTGDWYVYDSSRGLSSSTDPYFLMNSSAAQVTGTNYVDTDTTGFKVTAAAPAGLNSSGGTYIFLAIA